ncbi:MAG: aminoglycoside 3'-phosphotransferase [Anaerolineales bacterium]|nr:aminoglycoside 3'-phosphotransferase [Anaerolineales bacterium]MCB8954298.1 aminoglycoside 3'-phosphotransferase [Ardenticatenales bacterium]
MTLPRDLSLPADLSARVADCAWQMATMSWSGARVFRLRRPDNVIWYLKVAAGWLAGELQHEAAVMRWLAGKLPAPRCLYFARQEEDAYLLMTALAGADVTHFNDQSDAAKETAVRLLASGLRQLHSVPVADCPFDQRLAMKMPAAQSRLLAGLVDESDFDVEMPASHAYQELLRTRPPDEDLVFTHGDYCLPNIMVWDEQVSGFIDLGRAGIADRYQDLALCTRSLGHNFGPGWDTRFLTHYGLPEPDAAKVAFYRLLDEFF